MLIFICLINIHTVYSIIICPTGKHGRNCEYTCGMCKGGECFADTGYCVLGCQDGFRNPYCNQTCLSGYYGMDCSQKCGLCPGTLACHPITGSCMDGIKNGISDRRKSKPGSSSAGIVAGIMIVVAALVICASGFLCWKKKETIGKYRMEIADRMQKSNSLKRIRRFFGGQVSDNTRATSFRRQISAAENRHHSKSHSVGKSDDREEGKENVYINVGIDKVPIILLEESSLPDLNVQQTKIEKPTRTRSIKASYENVDLMDICLKELPYMIAENAGDNNRKLKEQHKQLKYGQQDSCEVGRKPENNSKNRFKALYAYDHSRIVLNKDDNGKSSDYINANYIDGVDEPKAYIACQGPKINTLSDHWLMIWQEDICIVVALTNLLENGKDKCYKYWPDADKPLNAGKFVISLQNRKDYSYYCIRYLSVHHTKTNEERTVVQFHYREWPDHGTPDTFSLVSFHSHVRREKALMAGKMLVHCSAGVGRTGTFLALDALLEHGRKTERINIYNYVEMMRFCRMNMVQTERQYIFIHEALREGFRYKRHAVTWRAFQAEYRRKCNEDQPKNENPLRMEYNELESMKPFYPKSLYKRAFKPINKTRNQMDVMPVDVYSVYLTTTVTGRNDYINAVFISTYTEDSAIIVTCSPLPHNVVDIWRLVNDHNVDAVVILASSGQPEFSHWLPVSSEIVEYEPFSVIREISPAAHEEIVESTAKFNLKEKSTTEVKIFEFLNWDESSKISTSPDNMVKMIEHVHDWRKSRYTDGPILVVSVDGVSTCGVFIAGYNAVEQLTTDDEVDLFNIVRQMRVRRPELITSFITQRGYPLSDKLMDAVERLLDRVEQLLDLQSPLATDL